MSDPLSGKRPPGFVPIVPVEIASNAAAGDAAFARIEPLPMPSAAAPSGALPAAEHSRWPLWAIVMSAALLLLSLSLGVLLWQRAPVAPETLPVASEVARREPRVAHAQVATDSAEVAQAAEAVLARRQAIEALAQRYMTARAAIDARGLSAWDAAAAAGLDARAQAARTAMQAHDFAQAEQAWQTALGDMQELQARADRLSQQAMQDGEAALRAGDADTAAAAFARALQIDAGNSGALAGQRRAANLAPLRASLTRAEVALHRGDFAAAEAAYREALTLAPDDANAQSGLARARAGQATNRFDALMSSGLTALQGGQFDAAERAFADAERLRPDASAARDGRLQVQLARERKRIADLRAEAELAERGEQWARAQSLYEQLVAGDGGLAFARDARARAAERAALDARLQAHLDHPERLSENAVRTDAIAALAAAAAVTEPGPRLRAQVARLQAQVEVASTPIEVALHSDGRTQILLYRVGDLGQFAERHLQLLPGSYTAVGRCVGYRDVRIEFTVRSGMPPVPPIHCEERI